jgi:hypothetical protein
MFSFDDEKLKVDKKDKPNWIKNFVDYANETKHPLMIIEEVNTVTSELIDGQM